MSQRPTPPAPPPSGRPTPGPGQPHVLVLQQTTGVLSNDFAIEDGQGRPIAHVHTRGSELGRMFMGSRQFQITGLNGATLFHVQDLATLGRDRYQVLDAGGTPIARIVQRFTLFTKQVDVEVADGTVLTLRGSLFEYDFQIMAGPTEVAAVSRQWSGLGRALLGHTTYVLRLDPAMPELVRYAVVGGVIALDLIREKESRWRRRR